MTHLVLIRHAETVPNPEVSSHDWQLSAQGKAGARRAAKHLERYYPGILASSPEPKAQRTAEIIGAAFGLEPTIYDNLREHDRRGVGFIESITEFREKIGLLFTQPNEVVFGSESALDALVRFQVAVERAILHTPQDTDTFVVTHGTVMTLFCARVMDIDPFPFWQSLGTPAVVGFTILPDDLLPRFEMFEIVEDLSA